MTFKRKVLAALTRSELLEVGRALELDVTTNMRLDDLMDAVAKSKKRGILEKILPMLSRDRLKDICEAVGISSEGREKQVLIDRILAAGGDAGGESDAEDQAEPVPFALSSPEPKAPKPAKDALVSPPQKGKPPEVQALNSAAIALLSAHLQGFVVDLFKEAAGRLLSSRVPDIGTLIGAAQLRGNPNEQNITKLFAAIGVVDVLAGISWQKCSNQDLRKKLRDFNELRNRIVHGKTEVVHKKTVEIYMSVWNNFAVRLDQKVGDAIAAVTGSSAW